MLVLYDEEEIMRSYVKIERYEEKIKNGGEPWTNREACQILPSLRRNYIEITERLLQQIQSISILKVEWCIVMVDIPEW